MFRSAVRKGLILLLPLVACPSAMQAKTVIVHWHNDWAGQDILDYLNQMKAEFEAAHPDIEVEIQTIPGGDYADKLVTSHAAGAGPDVAEWWPGPSTPMVSQGFFEPLDPYLRKDNIPTDRYIPSVLATVTWEGKIWALPSSGYPVLTMYNKRMWDEAGLVDPYDQGPGWTWDSLLSSGEKLTHRRADGVTDQYAALIVYNGLSRASAFAYEAGNGFFDNVVNPTKSLFTSPAVLTAYNWLNEVARRGLTPLDVYPDDEMLVDQAATMIKTGPQGLQSAAFLKGPGQLITPIGMAQMPTGPVNNATIFITDCWMMNALSKHKDAAWEWLKFIGADPAHSVRFVQHTGRIPPLVAALPSYTASLPKGTLHPEVIAQVSVAPTTHPGEVQSVNWAKINDIFAEHSMAVKQGTESPQEALQKIDQLVKPLL